MTALRGIGMSRHSYESDANVTSVAVRPETYLCPSNHQIRLNFAAEADEIPEEWDCPRCGRPAHRDEVAARRAMALADLSVPTPSPRTLAAGKTHWDMLVERRTEAELEALLQERLPVFRAL